MNYNKTIINLYVFTFFPSFFADYIGAEPDGGTAAAERIASRIDAPNATNVIREGIAGDAAVGPAFRAAAASAGLVATVTPPLVTGGPSTALTEAREALAGTVRLTAYGLLLVIILVIQYLI